MPRSELSEAAQVVLATRPERLSGAVRSLWLILFPEPTGLERELELQPILSHEQLAGELRSDRPLEEEVVDR